MNVIDFGRFRDLARDFELVRAFLNRRRAKGFAITVKDDLDQETTFFGGVYKSDPEAALKAAMRVSIELNRREQEPPEFLASNF